MLHFVVRKNQILAVFADEDFTGKGTDTAAFASNAFASHNAAKRYGVSASALPVETKYERRAREEKAKAAQEAALAKTAEDQAAVIARLEARLRALEAEKAAASAPAPKR